MRSSSLESAMVTTAPSTDAILKFRSEQIVRFTVTVSLVSERRYIKYV
jgi:hypothetical protein